MIIKRSILIFAAITLVIGLLLGQALLENSRNNALPNDTSPEAGFARDMGDHHQQAVDMAFIIRDKSANQAIKLLAFDIINTQATQRGMMMGWLEQWGLPQTTTRPPLAWLETNKKTMADHNFMSDSSKDHHFTMPGMASAGEIDKLHNLVSKEADILFIELMIPHHNGGISMAKSVMKLTNNIYIKRLAQTIVDSQQAEVDLLKSMLGVIQAQP